MVKDEINGGTHLVQVKQELTIEQSLMAQIESIDKLIAKHNDVCKKLQLQAMGESVEVEDFVTESTEQTMGALRAVKKTLLGQVAAIRKERASAQK